MIGNVASVTHIGETDYIGTHRSGKHGFRVMSCTYLQQSGHVAADGYKGTDFHKLGLLIQYKPATLQILLLQGKITYP